MKKEVQKTITVEKVVCDAHGCGAEVDGDVLVLPVQEFRRLSGTIVVQHELYLIDHEQKCVVDICQDDLKAIVAYVGRNLGENGG